MTTATPMDNTSTLGKRIAAKVSIDAQTGCWVWTGSTNSQYGQIDHSGKTTLAHRTVYQMLRGLIPAGLELDHLCRNTRCVNPDHLEPVTKSENYRRNKTDRCSMTTPKFELTEAIAAKVLKIVDKGLVSRLGNRKPGEFCVEAAVCYALDLPHGDDPGCVSPVLRSLKIRLNDSSWSSKAARAKGLRRLAVAQLGSKNHLDEKEFSRRVVNLALRKSIPAALRSAASIQKDGPHKEALYAAANRYEKEASREAAINARAIARTAYAAADAYDAAADAYAYDAANAAATADAAAYAAYAAAAAKKSARDKSLAEYAEDIVQILIEMKAPGIKWLSLTEVNQ